MTMTAHPALVLNADFRPMSYFPLSLLSWQDAVSAVFSERVSVVAEYDTWARSPSTLALLVLHGMQAVTMFDQVVWPPRERGMTCGGQARISARLSAPELDGLPLLGRPARGEARGGVEGVRSSSRSSVDQSTAVRRRGSRVQIAPRRPIRKVPLEWPATRLENGWAPQGVAFEPSAFRQHGNGRPRGRPYQFEQVRTDTQAATRPDCRSGAFGLRRFEFLLCAPASVAQW